MVPREQIQKLADDIAAKFAVEKIILFGSHAYGEPTESSDVDLLVVMEYEGSGIRKSVELLGAGERSFPCDLLVIRSHEMRRRHEQNNPIVGEAIDRGVVLYDRRDARVA